MKIQRITPQNRERITAFIMERWYTAKMIIRGKEIDMTTVDGLFCEQGRQSVGLITWLVYADADRKIMEIASLDSLCERQGIGTALLAEAVKNAREANARGEGIKKLILVTTNDNINALRFYQKRGFDMARLYRNAMEASRKIKPEIPLVGENGIPLRHEIEFEMNI